MSQSKDYKVWMIQMKDHPVSQMYVRTVLPSWKKHGVEVNLHEATTPKDLIYRNILQFGPKVVGRTKEFTSTEKAVWYSHFDLWCECVRSGPVLIIEHDSLLRKPLPDLNGEGYKLLSCIAHENRVFPEALAPGSGYYIIPAVAQRLVAKAVCQSIGMNSDGFLCEVFNYERQKRMKDYYYIEQITIDGLNTIDHNNPKKDYIGPDNENFDIPSIYRQA